MDAAFGTADRTVSNTNLSEWDACGHCPYSNIHLQQDTASNKEADAIAALSYRSQ